MECHSKIGEDSIGVQLVSSSVVRDMRHGEIMGNHPNSYDCSSVSRHHCYGKFRGRSRAPARERGCSLTQGLDHLLIATPSVIEVKGQNGLSEGMPPRGHDQRSRDRCAHGSASLGTGCSGKLVNMTSSILFLTLMNNIFIQPAVYVEPMPDLFALPFVDDDENDETLYIIDTGAGAHLSQRLAN